MKTVNLFHFDPTFDRLLTDIMMTVFFSKNRFIFSESIHYVYLLKNISQLATLKVLYGWLLQKDNTYTIKIYQILEISVLFTVDNDNSFVAL